MRSDARCCISTWTLFSHPSVARHPEYADKPVIIGIGNRSVVSAANYEARKYGINSAMASPGQENYARTASFCRWTSTTTVRCPDVSSQRCSPASPIASNRFPWMNAIWTSPARCCGGRVPAPSELGYAIRSPDGTTSPVPSASRRTSLSPNGFDQCQTGWHARSPRGQTCRIRADDAVAWHTWHRSVLGETTERMGR